MAGTNLVGTWEITGKGPRKMCPCAQKLCCDPGLYCDHGLAGVRFRLDENGDVTWTVPDALKSIPLFSCETYEIYNTTVYKGVLRFGAYAGHVLEFGVEQSKSKDCIVLTCEAWTKLHCKRVHEDTKENDYSVPFSLLPALEDGYFSNLTLKSANDKQFKVHTSILELQATDVSWTADPPPFSDLPEDVLGTILHFLYAECLPENLSEATAKQVVAAISQYPSLAKLANVANLYMKNMALKQQIIGLVNDMHESMNEIIEHFSAQRNLSTDDITSNPAKLCLVVKQSIRDVAVAGVKLVLLCDLFSKRKSELSRDERHEIIRYAKSRIPIFFTQLQRFLECLKNTFSMMSAQQRLQVATFLVPETEVIVDTISALIIQMEKALQQIIHVLQPHENSKPKQGVGDMLGKSLRNVLHIKELTKLRNFHEQITCILDLLVHKKENFNSMSPSLKVRSIARTLEQLIEELPIFLIKLEEVTSALDEKLEWREFKFWFKVGTSKMSGILQKLVAHQETLQEVMLQLCELVQRDSFTQSLQTLGLLEVSTHPVTSQPSESQKMPNSSSHSTPKQHHGYKLNLVESLCVPPSSNKSVLSKAALQLIKSEKDTDLEFEVINTVNAESEDNDEEERCIIKAHRVIVAARCDWFRRALLSGMREAIDKKITIHDTSPFLFRIFLEYLYSGKLKQEPLSTEQLIELLLLSDRYEVDSLKQTCEYSLESSIDEDSALYFLSMADQYNACILKKACLEFVSQHQELTENEVFFELPISVRAEVYECVWTQPTTKRSVTMEQLLPSSTTPPSPDSSMSDLLRQAAYLHLHEEGRVSNSSSMEELPLPQDRGRLDESLSQLRDIIGEDANQERLVQVILAADYDLNRAVHYYFYDDQEH